MQKLMSLQKVCKSEHSLKKFGFTFVKISWVLSSYLIYHQMSIENLFARIFRVLSLVLVIVAIFLSYFSFPDTVAVHHEHGKAVGFFPKNQMFYYMTGLVVVFYTLLTAFVNVFKKLPDSAMKFPNASTWLQNRNELNERVANWSGIAQGFFNTFFSLTLYTLTMVNLSETKRTIANYQWILIVGGFVLLIVLFWLPIRLLFSKPKPVVE